MKVVCLYICRSAVINGRHLYIHTLIDHQVIYIAPFLFVWQPDQILMAIDDSESMADCGAGALALAAMTTVASGLTQLEAGQLAVAR